MDMKQFTLLAIDDTPDNLFLLEQLVETYLLDCELVTACSAAAALDLAARRQFDGAIVDVQMPEIDGLELCRRLKSLENGRRLPVMLITAKGSTPRLRSEGLAAGADHFISRPIDNEELVAQIRVMLRLKQAEKELSSARDTLEHRVQVRTADLAAANRRLNEEIAERKRTQAALQEALEHASRNLHSLENSEKRFRSVVETASDAILYIDTTGKIVFCNKASCRIFGYENCEIVGQPLTRLMPERYRQAHQTGLQRYVETRHSTMLNQTIELVGLRRDGSEFPMELSIATWDTDAACYFTGIIRDITERKQHELRLHKSERELAVRNRIADAFLTLSGDDVFAGVLQIVLDVLDSRHGVFGYIDEAGRFVAPSMTEEVFAECRMSEKAAVFPPETWGDSIWGRAISQKRILFSNEPFRVPTGHIAMEREISSPIIYQDRVIGLINVANRPSDYDQNDVEMLRTICTHIAPVLHARLQRDRNERQRCEAEEALRRAHHALEDRVQERTAELTATNQQLEIEIAERRRAEEALRETNALLERVFATTQVSLAYIDTDLRFIRVNRAYAEHDSRPPEFFVGKRHFDLYPNQENEAIFRRVIRTGEPVEYYAKPFTYASHSERGVSYWDWSLLPVKNRLGQVEGLLLCLVDVTKRERAEAHVRKHQAQLAYVSRLSTMGEMSSAIAHELNQPLCAILTSAQASLRLLRSAGVQDVSVFDAIKQVANQARRAGDIIRHLRDFSRRRPFHRSTVHMGEVINEAAGFVAAEARPQSVRIQLDIPDELPVVLGDTIQLEQVLVNLMRNGIEAMEDTEEAHRRLDIRVRVPEPDRIGVSIRDTGRGLAEGDRERIFEPFYSTKPEGMGIGLAISRSIVEFHEGRLWAEPAPDGGTVFRLVLPVGGAGCTQ